MAASPRYSPVRQGQHMMGGGGRGIGSMPLLRLLKYAAAALGVYALGWRHGASQTPTVPAASTGGLQGADGGGGSGSSSSGGGGSLRASGPARIPPPSRPTANKEQRGWAGSVGAIEPVAANHEVDDRGRFIAKQVMIPPGTIPAVTGFSRAVLKPTQIVQRHSHATMHEVFYVEAGKGVFMIDDVPHVVGNGSFVHLPPGEQHAVLNSAQDAENGPDLVLLYFGVAVDSEDDGKG